MEMFSSWRRHWLEIISMSWFSGSEILAEAEDMFTMCYFPVPLFLLFKKVMHPYL